MVALHERDDTPTEPGAGETGARRAALDEGLDQHVELGGRHLVVVAQLAWLASRSGPSTDRSPVGSAAAVSSARAFSLTTWRARGRSRTCSAVASRNAEIPSSAAMASHSARRDAYSEPTRVRATPQCTTSTAMPGGMATGVTASERQSTSSACPARPKTDAS